MTKYHFNIVSLLIVLFTVGCKGSVNESQEDKIKSTESTEKARCNYTFDANGNREGKYICYYPNGTVWITGNLKNDSLSVYEQIIYYPSGKLKMYNFYNPLGELTFKRSYDTAGQVLKDEGDFLSHEELSKSQFFIGDSTVLKIFVATPPGISYKIFGVDSEGRYELSLRESEKTYLQKKIIFGEKVGVYTFPYEVEVIDSIRDLKEILKSDVTFKVRDR